MRNGSLGLALVLICVVAWAYWDERKQSRAAEAARLQDVKEMSKETNAQLGPMLKKVTKALTITAEVIRGHALTKREMGELSDDTPTSGVPLPGREGPK